MISPCDPEFFDLLAGSYFRLLGAPPRFLDPDRGHSASWLYREASHCVLAHDTQVDPHFIYANEAAQTCFGYSWDEFLTLPSRLSAEESERGERQRLLDAVSRKGFATGYNGVRVAKAGRRFRIEDGIVWQLIDREGMLRGQAATFGLWRDV